MATPDFSNTTTSDLSEDSFQKLKKTLEKIKSGGPLKMEIPYQLAAIVSIHENEFLKKHGFVDLDGNLTPEGARFFFYGDT